MTSARLARLFRPTLVLVALLGLAAPVAAPARTTSAHSVSRTAAARGAEVPAQAAAGESWLYRGSDVPHDKEWLFGVLPNGVRYAVRHNGVPPGQVSIRIRIDAGSLYEQDSERGFAHLLEHLVFRQSRYLAEGQAIPTWQRLGATFGSDTNAETSFVSTTFKLDLPDASRASLDESFKLLSGMMIAPALTEANIHTEVPIVLAEKRERGGTAAEVADATQQTLFAGQRLAVRPVIGTTETLEGAHQTAVRAFHARWYRPENAVIIAAGDIDPGLLGEEVRRWFGEWKAPSKPADAPVFGDPLPPVDALPAAGQAPVGEARVLVEPTLPRSITWAVMRPWRPVHDTVVYNQGLLVDALAQAVINRRLEAMARGGASFLSASVNQEKVSRSADGTFVSVTPLDGQWKKALAEVRGVIADALATAPSEEEIAREVAEMNVAFVNSVEQRRLMPGGKLADDLVQALDIRETVASPETVLAIFQKSQAMFTPQAVLAHTRALFTGSVSRAIYVTPSANEADAPALRLALAAPVAPDPAARPTEKPLRFADLPSIGSAGKIVGANPTGVLDVEQVGWANGVKALLWPSKDEPGRVTVKVRWGAGFRAFGPGDAAYITLGDMALVGSGEASLGQNELDRIATGRKMGFEFGVGDSSFQFSADTRRADLADQLYLLAAKFAMPRWDVAPVLRAKAAARLQYGSYAASPQGVLSRDLKFYERGRDPRFHTPTPAELDATTPAGFRTVWEPLLAHTGPIEVQIFGDFDREAALNSLSSTFGALPSRGELPANTQPPRVTEPKPDQAPVVLTHRGDPGQAAAVVAWPTGGGIAAISESRQLEILTQVFEIRLLDALREKLGAAYAPQVANNWPVDLDNGGEVLVLAQIAPKAVPDFFAIADRIASDLVARPPQADELARVTEPLRQQVSRASSSSAFFMYQLEGATTEPAKFAALHSMLRDFTRTTPEAMQALAAKYFGPGRSWRLAVIPEGQTLATAPSGAVQAVARTPR